MDRRLQAAKLGEALIGEDDEGTNYVLDPVLNLELSFQSWKFKGERGRAVKHQLIEK